MAFGLKYWFEFDDYYGRTCKLELHKDGYSGSVTELTISGENPVVITRNGNDDRFLTIIGSECTINLISKTDMQWSEFFNITYREWYVKYYISTNIFWEGYLIPDMYQEPYIAPPYQVRLKATDQLKDMKEHEYLDTGDVPYTGERNLSKIIGECLSYGGLNFGAGLHFLAAFNIFEDSHTTSALHDPLEMTKVDPALFYNKEGDSDVFDILDRILKILNCRVYYNRGFFEVMHIPQLAESSFAYRDFGATGGVSSSGTINDHKLAVTRPGTLNDCVWSSKSMILSMLSPLLQYTVKHNYNFRENLIRNGNFEYSLIKSDKPFYWTTSYTVTSDEYIISNNKLIIEKVSTSYYTLMYQILGDITSSDSKVHLKFNIKTTGTAAVEVKIGSGGSARYLTSSGTWAATVTRIEMTTDATIDILSNTITTTGDLVITINSLKSAVASYAVFSDLACEIVPDNDKWFPDYKKFIGDGNSGNKLKEQLDVDLGDMAYDIDILNTKAAYDGSLVAYYYSGANLLLAGMSWLWKRTGGTIWNNLLAFTVLDRIEHYKIPAYKISGKLRAKDIDFRTVLTDSSLTGSVFIQGRMTYNAKEASWEGDWLEIKEQASMVALSFSINPTFWTPGKAAQYQVVTVTANSGVTWLAEELNGVSWLSISNELGTGNGSFTLTVTENTTGYSRSETVRIRGTGIAFVDMIIQQLPI